MKHSDIIYLSGNGDISPYKIGFVFENKEMCEFELRRRIDLSSISFRRLQEDPIIYGKRNFQMVTSRQQAFEKFIHYDENEYAEGQLEFLQKLLN